MIRKEIISETKTVTKIFCDRCGEEIKRQYNKMRCSICGRHVCSNCSYEYDSDYLEYPYSPFDNPEVVCKVCWKLGKPYRKQIIKIEKEIDNIYETWIEEAKK